MNKKEVEEVEVANDLDYVLNDVGEFGKYQIGHFILMILPIVLSATFAVEFIVTGSTDDYRLVHRDIFFSTFIFVFIYSNGKVCEPC